MLFVVYPLLLKFVGKVSPLKFFRKSWTALEFAFVSRSSGATLPLSRQTAVEPRGRTGLRGLRRAVGHHHQDGRLRRGLPGLATIFIANMFGVQLSFVQYLGIVLVAVFGSLATAGTTGWFTMLTLTLSASTYRPR